MDPAIRFHWTTSIAIPIALWLCACRSNPIATTRPARGESKGPGRITAIDATDPLPSFDAYVTWRDRGKSVEYPLFYWNGEPVGRGHAGFAQILDRMGSLPRGATVLFYPDWCGCANLPNSAFLIASFAWPRRDDEMLWETVRRNGLVVILSPRDHLGRICPEILGAPLQSAPAEDARRFPIPKESDATTIEGETQPATNCSHEQSATKPGG
jgi:hypothetical protein